MGTLEVDLQIVVFWAWLAEVEAAHVPAAFVLPTDQVVHFESVEVVAGTIEDASTAVDADLDPSLDNIQCAVAAATMASACRAFDNVDFASAFELGHLYHSSPHLAGLLQSFLSALGSSHHCLRIEYLRCFGNSC